MKTDYFTCSLLMLALSYPVMAVDRPTGAFVEDAQKIYFQSESWQATADSRGWVSLKVGGDEFLHNTEHQAGIVFRKGENWISRFPSRSITSHDRWAGYQGVVGDGLYMLRLRPAAGSAGIDLYAGFNDHETHDLVLLLSDDVRLARVGTLEASRTSAQVIRHDDKPRQVDAPAAILVHRSGRSLLVDSPCRVEVLRDPSGDHRLALVLPCKGFAANELKLVADPVSRAANFVSQVGFEVTSDPNRFGGSSSLPGGVKSAIYEPGDRVRMGLRFEWDGDQPFSGSVVFEARHALGQPHFKHEMMINPDKKDDRPSNVVSFEPKLSLPGVSDVWARLLDEQGRVVWADTFRILYDFESYKPVTNAPPDLQAFWGRTLDEMRSHELDPKVSRIERVEDHPDFEIYQVSFNALHGKRIWAIMYVPREAERPLPAIVTAHPGSRGLSVSKQADGTYGARMPADPRFVTIQPLIRGHRPDAEDIPFNHPWWGDLTSRDEYAARAWYAAMVRSIDYLATRPDLVDMERIVARGGSQGGTLALATAALDDRVKFCFADSPSNGQFHELIDGKYSSFGPTPGQVPPGQTADELKRMLSYFDPVNLASMIQCPTYIGLHAGDLTVHSMGGLAVYHNLASLKPEDKGFFPAPGHFHAASKAYGETSRELLRQIAGELVPQAKDGR